jgi:hypothetical protein
MGGTALERPPPVMEMTRLFSSGLRFLFQHPCSSIPSLTSVIASARSFSWGVVNQERERSTTEGVKSAKNKSSYISPPERGGAVQERESSLLGCRWASRLVNGGDNPKSGSLIEV